MHSDDIHTILVVGAGYMGHGIAQVYAQAGFTVWLVDLNREALDRASALMQSSLKTLEEHGGIPQGAGRAIMERIRLSTDLRQAASEADYVVEAVSENAPVKQAVFEALHAACGPEVIFASNTSGLDIFSLVDESRARQTIATHFFLPAQIIPLVEVCPGPRTDAEVVEIACALLARVGKETVVMRQFIPSFIVNRIQNYMAMAVFELLANNWATPEEIDSAVKASIGVRLPVVGVVQLMDFTGLDLVSDISKSYGFTIPLIEALVSQGHLGAKSARGLYDYGNRSEAEIVAERDRRYLDLLGFLQTRNNAL